MARFTLLDALVVISYIFLVAGIGLLSRFRGIGRKEYFLGNRRFGRAIHFFAAFGQVATADGPVGVATATFYNGISGIWTSLNMLFSTPLLWVVASWLRRLRITTMADFYVERYGSRRLAICYALIATVGMMSVLSAGFLALAKTTVALTGSPLSPAAMIWIYCAFALSNALLGGVTAAFRSAVVQGTLVLFVSVIMIPVGLAQLGTSAHPFAGFAELHHRLPANFFSVFGSENLPDFSWSYIGAIAIMAGLSTVTQPNLLVTCAAAHDEEVARFGVVAGTLAKRVCTIFWGLCGLVAVALYRGSIHDSDFVWGFAARSLLAPLGVGFVGLMLAAMLAAFTAASNSLMLSTAGLMTENIYRVARPNESETHYISVGRIAGALFLSGGALIAAQFGSLFSLLKLNWEFFAIFTAAFWLGMKWRRANCRSAWASILVPIFLYYALPIALVCCAPHLRQNTTLNLVAKAQAAEISTSARVPSIFWSDGLERSSTGDLVGRGYPYLDLLAVHFLGRDLSRHTVSENETLRTLLRITLPFVILIIAAYLTRRDDAVITSSFFERMRRRAVDLERAKEAVVTPLFKNSEWELYRWNRSDAIGFACTIVFVFGTIGLLIAVTAIGR